ncbi:YggT family protein [Bacillota bacterium LX-D]|nr:YggT family protein [Bacillota bacterium LX-D]
MIYTIVYYAFEILSWLIIARVLLSWIPHDPSNKIIGYIYEITEPVLAPFRRLMPRSAMPIDFSPLLAILVLQLLERMVLSFFR